MHRLTLALVLLAASTGCKKTQDDATIRKLLVGVWSFRPHEQLPPEEITDGLGTSSTPVEDVFEFGPIVASDDDRGSYVEYRHTAKDDHTAEQWTASKRENWYVLDGTLYFESATGFGQTTKVLSVNSRYLRVSGGASFPCMKGCELARLAKVPDEAQSATVR